MLQIPNCSRPPPHQIPLHSVVQTHRLPTVKLDFRKRLSPSRSLFCPLFFMSRRPRVIEFQNCTITLLQRSEGRTKSEQRENILCQLEFPPAEQKQPADGLVGPHSPTSLSFACRFARWWAAGGIVSQIMENCVWSFISYVCASKTDMLLNYIL